MYAFECAYIPLCISVGMHATACTEGQRTTPRSWFSPSSVGSGVELRTTTASASTHWAISLALTEIAMHTRGCLKSNIQKSSVLFTQLLPVSRAYITVQHQSQNIDKIDQYSHQIWEAWGPRVRSLSGWERQATSICGKVLQKRLNPCILPW